MEFKASVGPKLLKASNNKWKSAYAVIFLGLCAFKSYFPRLPFYLEWIVFLFVAFRLGHVIHRLILCCQEKDVIRKLYKESKFCCMEYIFGDFILEFGLFALTAFYYKTLYHGNGNAVLAVVFLCTVISILNQFANHFSDPVTKRTVAQQCKLNIGYGLAYFYYHNYLVRLVRENKFVERLAQYAVEQEVPLSAYKLFILVSHNCVVEKYIDNDPNQSMRAKEAPPLLQDIAGIKGRVYNNTVYELFVEGAGNPKGVMRLVMECAQPMKQLRELYTSRSISEEEMLYERQSFISNLKKFLHDDYDSFKTIVIVPCEGTDSIADNVIKAANDLQEKKMV